MARLVEQIEQLEAELTSVIDENARLQDVVNNLEDTCNKQSTTIGELQWANGELQEFEEFILEHFPEAVEAYKVRERMEKASEA